MNALTAPYIALVVCSIGATCSLLLMKEYRLTLWKYVALLGFLCNTATAAHAIRTIYRSLYP